MNCFDLPGGVKLALELNRPVIEAQDALKGPVADDQLFDLMLAAGYSRDEASDALSARVADKLRHNQQVNL